MTEDWVAGDICLENNCHFCCVETEMLLSKSDIKRIASNTRHLPEEFSDMTNEGYYILKNKRVGNKEQCFFLDSQGKCKIYAIRPEGCQYYPCIWDLTTHEPFTDDICPYHKQFEDQIEKIRNKLELFVLKVIGEL